MKTGRQDYDALLRSRHIPEGEPTFLLRGRDIAAADTVHAYAIFARHAGASPDLVESALQQADRMASFEEKRVPDLGDLPARERRHLAFVHQRRVWALGHGAPHAVALALRPLSPTPDALLRQMAAEHDEAARQAQVQAEQLQAHIEAIGKDPEMRAVVALRMEAEQTCREAVASLTIRAAALRLAADALQGLIAERVATTPQPTGGSLE